MNAGWLAAVALLTACKRSEKAAPPPPPPPAEQSDDARSLQPFVVAERIDAGLARDDRFLYWLQDDGVRRRPLGGPRADAAKALDVKLETDGVLRIAVHDGVLYALREDALVATSLDGKSTNTVVERPLQDVAVDAGGIYVASADRLLRIPLGGGDPEQLATAPATIQSIALFDDSVYWSELGGHAIRRIATTGGSVTVALETFDPLDSFALDARGLVHAGGLAVIERTRLGPVYARRGTGEHDLPYEVVTDDAWIYLVEGDEVVATPRDDLDPVVIPGDPQLDMWTQLEAGRLFWVDMQEEEDASDVRVMSADLTHGTTTELAPFADRPLELAVGGGFVYWSGVAGEGVWRAPVTGGPPELYSEVDFLDTGYMAFGADTAYWVEGLALRGRREGSREIVEVGTITDDGVAGPYAVIGDEVAVTRHVMDKDEGVYVYAPSKPARLLWSPNGAGGYGLNLTAVGDELMFEDAAGGVVAVKLDGTQRQLIPGASGMGVSNLAVAAGKVYADRSDGIYRIELATGATTVIRDDVLGVIAAAEQGVLLEIGNHAAWLPHDAPPRVEVVVSPPP